MMKYDEIGYWSEIKLEIVSKYASAYSKVLTNQPLIRRHLYIGAFAGAGIHISKQTQEYVPGSPMNALLVQPTFHEFHFIDLDGDKIVELRKLRGVRDGVQFMRGILIQSLKKLCFCAVVTKIIIERFVCSTPMAYT